MQSVSTLMQAGLDVDPLAATDDCDYTLSNGDSTLVLTCAGQSVTSRAKAELSTPWATPCAAWACLRGGGSFRALPEVAPSLPCRRVEVTRRDEHRPLRSEHDARTSSAFEQEEDERRPSWGSSGRSRGWRSATPRLRAGRPRPSHPRRGDGAHRRRRGPPPRPSRSGPSRSGAEPPRRGVRHGLARRRSLSTPSSVDKPPCAPARAGGGARPRCRRTPARFRAHRLQNASTLAPYAGSVTTVAFPLGWMVFSLGAGALLSAAAIVASALVAYGGAPHCPRSRGGEARDRRRGRGARALTEARPRSTSNARQRCRRAPSRHQGAAAFGASFTCALPRC